MISLDRYLGCISGLTYGDAYGAAYEGGLFEKLIWKIIGRTKKGELRYTDDTQMSIDIAQSYLSKNEIDSDCLAEQFAKSYQYSRGYGPSAAWLLKQIKKGSHWKNINKVKFSSGSWGNGAAMRAPVIGLIYAQRPHEMNQAIFKSSVITHAHPLAIEGAKIIALTVSSVLCEFSTEHLFEKLILNSNHSIYRKKLETAKNWILYSVKPSQNEIKLHLGNQIQASESVISAVYFAIQFKNHRLDQMLHPIFKLGGDTDTIGSMAGSIWGAINGLNKIRRIELDRIEKIDWILNLGEKLYFNKQEPLNPPIE